RPGAPATCTSPSPGRPIGWACCTPGRYRRRSARLGPRRPSRLSVDRTRNSGPRRARCCLTLLGLPAADQRSHRAELAGGASPEERDRQDADDGDQADEEGVLHEAGPLFIGGTGPRCQVPTEGEEVHAASAADGRTDGAEAAGSALAEERDGQDADHSDESHQEGVLDEAGAPLAL